MRHILSFALALTFTTAAHARPRPLPVEEWDEDTMLTLGRAMVGEADWHEPDHVAIAYVLARRWRVHQKNRAPLSFRSYIRLYSASLRSTSERSLWIQSLPWGPMPGLYEKRWDRVRHLVKAWGNGRIKDPCPNAVHWGGAMDRPSRRWQPVTCGLTRNIFYGRGTRTLAQR